MREINYISVEAVAEHFNVSVSTVRKWAIKNDIPYVKEIEEPPKEDNYVRVKKISEMIGIPETTIKKWADNDKIPYVKIAGINLRLQPSEVLKWANKKGDMSTLDDSDE